MDEFIEPGSHISKQIDNVSSILITTEHTFGILVMLVKLLSTAGIH